MFELTLFLIGVALIIALAITLYIFVCENEKLKKDLKYKKGLVRVSRHSLAEAECRIEQREKFIKIQQRELRQLRQSELNKENQALHEENKDLRFEYEEAKDTMKDIIKIASGNKYGKEIVILNKIKELVQNFIAEH